MGNIILNIQKTQEQKENQLQEQEIRKEEQEIRKEEQEIKTPIEKEIANVKPFIVGGFKNSIKILFYYLIFMEHFLIIFKGDSCHIYKKPNENDSFSGLSLITVFCFFYHIFLYPINFLIEKLNISKFRPEIITIYFFFCRYTLLYVAINFEIIQETDDISTEFSFFVPLEKYNNLKQEIISIIIYILTTFIIILKAPE